MNNNRHNLKRIHWDINRFRSERVFPVVIEIPSNSMEKYEYDSEYHTLIHKGCRRRSYPGNYGFIPSTLSGDGDPLDVLVRHDPLIPMSIVMVKAIGGISVEDKNGIDDKLLCIPFDSWLLTGNNDQLHNEIDRTKVLEYFKDSSLYFFQNYKNPGEVIIKGTFDTEEAYRRIEESVKEYQSKPHLIF